MNNKYIVVVLNYCYPSVLHFDKLIDAEKRFKELQGEGYTVHLANIVDTFHVCGESREYSIEEYKGKSNIIDIEWYL